MAQNESFNSDVDRLIHQLKYDKDVFARIDAARALASCMDIKAALSLIEALRYKSSMEAEATIEGIPVELHLYGAGDIQTTVASSLVHLASRLKDERLIGTLIKALQDEDKYVQRVIFVVLCELSAQLRNDSAVEVLVQIQPEIDKGMRGHAITEYEGRKLRAADCLCLLLEKLKEERRPQPFIIALKSKTYDIVIFAVTTLLEMGQSQSIAETVKHTDIPAHIFDGICMKFKEIDAELALTSLIQILQNGSPRMRVCAARNLRSYSDNRAVDALSEWQGFLRKTFGNEIPNCPHCGRGSSRQLQNGSYWCSWCAREFSLDEAYAGREERKGE